MGLLNGKLAIVTGASRLNGIGAAICKELAENGCNIFFTYWTAYDNSMPWKIESDEPARLKEELESFGVKVASLEVDLSQTAELESLLKQVESESGQADILVNNAAYSTGTGYSTLTIEELDRHYRVNVRATTMLSIGFAKRFTKKSGGRIINLTSGQSKGPMPGELAYATTKGAVDALTITLSAEVATLGITVNAVNPGPTDSGWMTPEIQDALQPRFPFGRPGEQKDAAKLVKFLASDDAAWITGQIIHSEGGFVR
ncbi:MULTISPECIES: SDR family oxidoreductase [Planococcaceae]|uniref:Oxidoreductase n=1 Tax=Planococcus halotolerans TaxID=2233542 RepID=A0A365KXH5_9BACL|nr:MULTISPECIES: SDR family oxidoreductase [Planococcaceae]QHJ72119.1 SDR family oxidoreductase [Planococcus halotolerans]RAZ77865.1 oxidoreductase [Planococcus halotolerans]RLQ91491.1 SDR family oxidoreductase [Planomicrobium sp. Y74]